MTFYIYKITNKINNKCYIGQSGKIRDRWVGHKRCAMRVKNGATIEESGIQAIHFAIAKYGVENFSFDVIDEATTKEEANKMETEWVAHFDSYNNGYNCTYGGDNAPKTQEWKDKMSTLHKMRYLNNPDTIKPMVDGKKRYLDKCRKEGIKHSMGFQVGHSVSDETREKIRQGNLGRVHSPEEIEKRRAALQRYYRNSPLKGRKYDYNRKQKHKKKPRKYSLTDEQERMVLKRVADGHSKRSICRDFGITWGRLNKIIEAAK